MKKMYYGGDIIAMEGENYVADGVIERVALLISSLY